MNLLHDILITYMIFSNANIATQIDSDNRKKIITTSTIVDSIMKKGENRPFERSLVKKIYTSATLLSNKSAEEYEHQTWNKILEDIDLEDFEIDISFDKDTTFIKAKVVNTYNEFISYESFELDDNDDFLDISFDEIVQNVKIKST